MEEKLAIMAFFINYKIIFIILLDILYYTLYSIIQEIT